VVHGYLLRQMLVYYSAKLKILITNKLLDRKLIFIDQHTPNNIILQNMKLEMRVIIQKDKNLKNYTDKKL